MAFILLPIHLFHENILKPTIHTLIEQTKTTPLTKLTIYLLEEPVYFGDRTNAKLNFNKLKLIYHRATMQYYFAYLKSVLQRIVPPNKSLSISIEYVEYRQLLRNTGYTPIKKHSVIYMFDPVDTDIYNKYKKLFTTSKLKPWIETPLFLSSSADLEAYHQSKANKQSYFHATFYKWQRERLHILENSKTYDTENRESMPIDTIIPPLPANDSHPSSSSPAKYIEEAIKYVNAQWPNNLEPVYCQRKEKPITPKYTISNYT